MPRKGENIYKRKDGRWEARYIKAYAIDGKAKYGYCYAASYHEVREKVSLIKEALLSDQPTATGTVRKRFAVYCDEWLKLNRLKVKESTYVKYYATIHKLMIDFCHERNIIDVADLSRKAVRI